VDTLAQDPDKTESLCRYHQVNVGTSSWRLATFRSPSPWRRKLPSLSCKPIRRTLLRVTNRQLRDIALNGRNVVDLLKTVPGVIALHTIIALDVQFVTSKCQSCLQRRSGTVFSRIHHIALQLSAMSRNCRFVTTEERSPDSVQLKLGSFASTVTDSETLPTPG